jgi:fructose-bisphosphate aldolase class I
LIPDGNYTIEDCAKVSTKIFTEVFRACADYKVHFDGCLFKPHMIKEGSECKKLNPPDVVAEKTVEVF